MFRLYSNWFPIQLPSYSPDVAPPANTGMSKEDTIEFLGQEDDTQPEVIDLKETKKATPKSGDDAPKESPDDENPDESPDDDEDDEDDEIDELEELEAEADGPTEEQLELVTPVRRQEILKKYPTLFKDFPYLEKAYYREQQFTELLPTIDDAREAVRAKETLDRFETDIMGGNTQKLLSAVKSENPKGFNKIVNNYLPTLKAVDEQAYFHLMGNVVKHTVAAMYGSAQENGDEDLKNAAIALNKFVFNTTKYTPPGNLDENTETTDDRKSKELEMKERKFNEQRLNTSKTELKGRVDNVLRSTVEGHIDPKGSMTDYVKKVASRDALETLNKLIERDSRFKILVDKLWARAAEKDYDKSSVDAVKSAILSKAKTLLPAVIKKARNEALRGTGKRVKTEESDEREENNNGRKAAPKTTRTSASSETPRRTGRITNAKDIPAGMSSLEFLNSD